MTVHSDHSASRASVLDMETIACPDCDGGGWILDQRGDSIFSDTFKDCPECDGGGEVAA